MVIELSPVITTRKTFKIAKIRFWKKLQTTERNASWATTLKAGESSDFKFSISDFEFKLKTEMNHIKTNEPAKIHQI